MTGEPPPSRYRVVEQGRRLVVIDTATGAPATRGRDVEPAPVHAAIGPERIAFDGRSILVTRRFYDSKGPRRLTLDEGTTRWIDRARTAAIGIGMAAVVVLIVAPGLAVALLPLAAILLGGRTRATMRAHLTRWLDRYDASAG